MDFEKRRRRGGGTKVFSIFLVCVLSSLSSYNGAIEWDIVMDILESAAFELDKRLNIVDKVSLLRKLGIGDMRKILFAQDIKDSILLEQFLEVHKMRHCQMHLCQMSFNKA